MSSLLTRPPRWILWLALALCGLVIFVAYRSLGPTVRGREPVTISTIVYPGSVPLYVAREKGFFEKEGLDVKLVPFSSGKAGLDQVLQDKLDYCLVAELPIVRAVLDGRPVAVVATMFSAERDHRLIARPDRGIASPADLKGKTIGTSAGTTADLVLDLVLTAGKLSRDDVRIVPLEAENTPAAIVNGQLDAISTWEPYLNAALEKLQGNSVVFDAFDIQGAFTVNVNVVMSRNRAREKAATTEKVLRAIIRAEEYIRTHPDESQLIATRSSGLSKEILERLWNGYRFEVRLDQSLMISLEDTARWVMRYRQRDTRALPDFRHFVVPDTLAAIDAGAVRLIR